VSVLDGSSPAEITHLTQPISMHVSGNHSQKTQFYAFTFPKHPWSWDFPGSRSIGLGVELPAGAPPVTPAASDLRRHARLFPPSRPDADPSLAVGPLECMDLADAFSKKWALSLPPHHPYDCFYFVWPLSIKANIIRGSFRVSCCKFGRTGDNVF